MSIAPPHVLAFPERAVVETAAESCVRPGLGSRSPLATAALVPHFTTPTFEGPLDLLLHLIRANEVDIYDIPIVEITTQYLAYMEKMEALDLAVAGEYVVMAATLIEIKSRMLLPQAPPPP